MVPADPLATDADRQEAARAIVQWSLEQLAYYKAPGYVAFVDSLPLTTTNKIQRGEMKALAPAARHRALRRHLRDEKKTPKTHAGAAR